MLKCSGFAHRSPVWVLTDLSLTPLPLRASPVPDRVWVFRSLMATAETVAAVGGLRGWYVASTCWEWPLNAVRFLHITPSWKEQSVCRTRQKATDVIVRKRFHYAFYFEIHFSWQRFDVAVACFNTCVLFTKVQEALLHEGSCFCITAYLLQKCEIQNMSICTHVVTSSLHLIWSLIAITAFACASSA